MGCAQSKIDNEESVARCKEKRNLMKEAVSLRNAFASAHSGFSASLKDTGAALSDYAQGEVPPPPEEVVVVPPASDQSPPPLPVESSLLPPPPPLPSFSPITPIYRSLTMPAALSRSQKAKGKRKDINIYERDIYEEDGVEKEEKKDFMEVGLETPPATRDSKKTPPEIKGMAWDYFFIDNMPQKSLEEDGDEEEDYMEDGNDNLKGEFNFDDVRSEMDFRTPEKQGAFAELKTPEDISVSAATEKRLLHSNTASPTTSRIAVRSDKGMDLLKILSEIDDHFLKACQSSQEVSKMLEATRVHNHLNVADNRGHIDHAARVMQVITWNKSLRGAHDSEGANNNPVGEDSETHATVLDKLLAWEKKLYEEVKAGELMKLEYQRKIVVLNKLKKRNASSEQLNKAKAAVSHLHTRYIVDMQSLDSTVLEVDDIRDKQLYPKLVKLVHEMAKMWESMCSQHDGQLKIVADLKVLDVSGVQIATSKHHHERTKQLSTVVEEWHSQFEKLITNQRQYINVLNSWLKLNLVPIESSLKEKVLSPPRIQNPPIQPLLQTWHDHLEKLPDDVAKNAISSFAAVIKTIFLHQEEELKLKEKYEETQKEYLRKKVAFEEWYHKYMQRRTPSDDVNMDKESNTIDPALEKKFIIENLKKRLEEEIEDHKKHCIQVREKSLGSLKIRLPELFRAMSDYSHACYAAYEKLRLLTLS